MKLEEAAWGGEDDDLDIDDEIMADNKVTAEEAELVNNDIYVPP